MCDYEKVCWCKREYLKKEKELKWQIDRLYKLAELSKDPIEKANVLKLLATKKKLCKLLRQNTLECLVSLF